MLQTYLPPEDEAAPPEGRTVRVELRDRAYDIRIGPGLIDRAGELMAPVLPQQRVVVVSDETTAALYLPRLEAALARAGIAAAPILVPPGEGSKSFARLESVLERMLASRLERSVAVVALGGGVVGDLAGFAAAIALRGLPFVQVPTTLLSQVDSAVGGKTGINTGAGKNLVGSFHQPRLVVADTGTLATLPRRELLAGYAEVVKYGAITDAPFFAWLERHGIAALGAAGDAGNSGGDPDGLALMVAASCRNKAAVVAADERETAGPRALLNFGHTFGHALEAAAGFDGSLLHGEAVAIGMVLAADLSVRLGLCAAGDAGRLRAHLEAAGLPTRLPGAGDPRFAADALLAAMGRDKKVDRGRLTFVLIRGLGRAFLAHDVDPGEVAAHLRAAGAA